jgi:hypothetical protein
MDEESLPRSGGTITVAAPTDNREREKFRNRGKCIKHAMGLKERIEFCLRNTSFFSLSFYETTSS